MPNLERTLDQLRNELAHTTEEEARALNRSRLKSKANLTLSQELRNEANLMDTLNLTITASILRRAADQLDAFEKAVESIQR
jgi:hypothetical protein